MAQEDYANLETLDCDAPIWEQFFTVAPLVLIGSLEENGDVDFAPKHMAFPLGLENFFGFVCTPRHNTYGNVQRTGCFTVSYPRPSGLAVASLTAAPRCDDRKPVIDVLDTFEAKRIAGRFVRDAHLYLECELDRIVGGFGEYGLIAGRVVAAHVHHAALRSTDRDDAEVVLDSPHLAYLHPTRLAVIGKTDGFPFPAGMKR
jgi:flavin reductase (DIM6/NTAB) family NADH-FMN oxidoreductase RutF